MLKDQSLILSLITLESGSQALVIDMKAKFITKAATGELLKCSVLQHRVVVFLALFSNATSVITSEGWKNFISFTSSLPCPRQLWMHLQEGHLVLLGPPLYPAGHRTSYAGQGRRCYPTLSFSEPSTLLVLLATGPGSEPWLSFLLYPCQLHSF